MSTNAGTHTCTKDLLWSLNAETNRPSVESPVVLLILLKGVSIVTPQHPGPLVYKTLSKHRPPLPPLETPWETYTHTHTHTHAVYTWVLSRSSTEWSEDIKCAGLKERVYCESRASFVWASLKELWGGGGGDGGLCEGREEKSGLHTHPFFPFSCSISLLGLCFVFPLLLPSYKCHSLLLAATIDDLFQRGRGRKRDEREGGRHEKEKWQPFNLCFWKAEKSGRV